VSGHGDSIRERRARESWEDRREEEDSVAQTTIVVTTLGLLAANVFIHPEEASGFIENYIHKKLDLEYLRWNGRTDVQFILSR